MGWVSLALNSLRNNPNIRRFGKAGLVFCIYYEFTNSVADIYLLAERSMEPTLSGGQIVLSEPIHSSWPLNSYFGVDFDQIKVGDIIVAKNPSDPQQNICKRVTGLEGDRIPLEYRQSYRFVPPGQIWVEGDNSTESRDSRNYGPVPLGLVRGRVVARLWPVKECGLLE